MKIRRFAAALIAVMTLCLCIVTAAPAESSHYEEQVRKFESMKARTIDLEISFAGMYVAKSAKFYGRKVTGVAADGSFILGGWDVLYKDTSIPMSFPRKTISGTYVQFAYSVDIVWGTDWPFSRIFWTDVNNPVKKIEIINQGFVRNVDVAISVETVSGQNGYYFRDSNCSSHKEWKP